MTEQAFPSPGCASVPSRYDALHRVLCAPAPSVIELSFVEIHRLGSNLSHRARTDEDWWSNGPEGDPQRVTWLAAGRQVRKIDVERSRVWFATIGEGHTVVSLDDAQARSDPNDKMS